MKIMILNAYAFGFSGCLRVILYESLAMFSKACEYSIRATIFIATCTLKGRRTNLKEISEEIESPVAFTAKLLQQLNHHNIVKSVKGVYGGFEIEQSKLETLKLSEVVDVIDGDAIYTRCGLGLKTCSPDNPCPLHSHFKSIRSDLKEMLETTGIENLSRDLMSGKASLKSLK
jgi:Rrf2 family protein